MLSSTCFAADANSSKWLYETSAQFERSREPLIIEFKLGPKKHRAKHQHQDFNTISNWRRGQALRLSYSSIHGTVLLDTDGEKIPILTESAAHPLQRLLEDCMRIAANTRESSQCIARHQQHWDNELNRAYHLLTNWLDPARLETIKSAQRQWIKYRDQQELALQAIYAQKQGSIWPLEAGLAIAAISSEQAQRLNRLYWLRD